MNRPSRTPPIADMLERARGTARFHMPGHKGLLDIDDVTELARTDDLYAPAGAIAEAERLAAHSFGASHTLFLTGGSTAGLMAMLLSCVSPGETILLPRSTTHHAVLSACVWGDINAVFDDELLAAIAKNPHARAVLVTRPDYYGRCVDLAAIVQAAHADGMLVLVDEAHGAHFAFWDAPQSAGKLGADAWVQSAHKTLPALTGTAMLHLSPTVDADRTRRFLRMVQTSSPPFPLLRSIDWARAWMDEYGRDALASLAVMLRTVCQDVAQLGGYMIEETDDPTRLVIGTRGRGYSGMEVQERLSALGVDVEMADDACIVCICTVADTEAAFARLVAALAEIPQTTPLADTRIEPPPAGGRVCSLRKAALGPQESVPLAQSAGRTAAVSVGMYPPGIPWVLPGERITDACVHMLSALPESRRFGMEHENLTCVKGE